MVLRASRSRVWRAITTAAEFGAWFRVNLEGEFAEGATVRGRITHPGYDRIPLARRAEAFRMNDQGWAGQIKNLAQYVS